MQFAWDVAKSRANQAKHKVSFELAMLVFADPHVLSLPDDCETEDRWLTIGRINDVIILAVVHTSEDQHNAETIRIISARKATRRETQAYESQHKKS
jgi:uncharacterized protein